MKVAVVGVGLIGGSIGLAARQRLGAHVCGYDPSAGALEAALMRGAIVNFLKHHGVTPTRYHETLTQAWILAVFHFMHRTPSALSAEDFVRQTPLLLDSRIMLTHYSAELLYSPRARSHFVPPDLDPIPRHAA